MVDSTAQDVALAEKCKDFLIGKDIKGLLSRLVKKTIETKPADHIQYLVDLLQFEDESKATQVST